MEASSKIVCRLLALGTAVLTLALVLAPMGIARGATTPGTGLAPNEVLVGIRLEVWSKTPRQTSGGYGENWSAEKSSTFSAIGEFAGTLTIPSTGKRALTLTRRLPGHLTGSLDETITGDRHHIITEGGVNKDFLETFTETWWRSGVDLKPMDLSLVLDLDESTWTCARFGSTAEAPLNQILRSFNYSAVKHGVDLDGVKRTWSSGDHTKPPPDMHGGIPQESVGAVGILWGEFGKLTDPRTLDIGDGVYSGHAGGSIGSPDSFQAGYIFFWDIRTKPPELELRVTSPALSRWRPQAEPSDSPGDVRAKPGPALDLTAEVVDPAGTKPLVRIRKLRWWLEGTSRLPGFAMNMPYGSSETSVDMEIDHPKATAEGQELVLTDLTTLRSKVRIKPYDWGAWSTLHVEAELDDGRKLTGKLKGPAGDETDIRLPARDADSKIADVWKRENSATGKYDDDDDEYRPWGARNGDGFTVFEEYRGFYGWTIETSGGDQPPAHHSSDPRTKTVFVYNRIIKDPDTNEALRLFRNASEAQVYVFKPTYDIIDESRLVNRNLGDGPTKGPQHAIGTHISANWGPVSPGSPGGKEVYIKPWLEIFSPQNKKSTLNRALYPRAIAAKLLMACNVGTPGRHSKIMPFWVVTGADGGPATVTTGGRYVTLRDEATGLNLAEEWLRGAIKSGKVIANRALTEPFELFPGGLIVAERGGDHSGPLKNIMRSAYAEAYEVEGTDTIYVNTVPPAEKLGYDLTDTSVGDGYNDPNSTTPRTRYGSSQAPASRDQFDVIDRAP